MEVGLPRLACQGCQRSDPQLWSHHYSFTEFSSPHRDNEEQKKGDTAVEPRESKPAWATHKSPSVKRKVVFCCCCCCFLRQESHFCSSGYPGTHYVNQTGYVHRDTQRKPYLKRQNKNQEAMLTHVSFCYCLFFFFFFFNGGLSARNSICRYNGLA